MVLEKIEVYSLFNFCLISERKAKEAEATMRQIARAARAAHRRGAALGARGPAAAAGELRHMAPYVTSEGKF